MITVLAVLHGSSFETLFSCSSILARRAVISVGTGSGPTRRLKRAPAATLSEVERSRGNVVSRPR